MQYKILFVDDETANLRLLERLFRGNYEVHTASSGEEALELLRLHDVALIISDQRMPTMTGSEFLKHAAEMRPQTVRIMLTGYTDTNDLVEAINSGIVYKYITKPWVNDELNQTVLRALQHYETIRAQGQLQAQCERLQFRLIASRNGFVDVLLQLLDSRSPNLRQKAVMTSNLAILLAEKFEMEPEQQDILGLAARLLDTSMLYSASHYFQGAFPLASAGDEQLKNDQERALQSLGGVPGFEEAVDMLRYVSEHFDGNGEIGYAGSQIPLSSRILAASQAYTSHFDTSSDNESTAHLEVMDLIWVEAGKKFDPTIIEAIAEIHFANGKLSVQDIHTESGNMIQTPVLDI